MHSIRMESVNRSYGDNVVLADLNLEVRTGEVFALLGPNGAGKTTAVEILEGFRRPDSGLVDVLGYDPAQAGTEFLSRIGIVLQQTTSFEKFTVLETVEMFGSLFPNPYRSDEIIELVGLSAQRDQMAETLSGGQRRRVDVACGLVGRPELLFLDEPSTGLDPQARRAMWDLIASLRAQGTTVLLTTHYLDEAEALADRIGVLLGGRLRDVGTAAELGRRHAASTVVRFLPPPGFDVRWASEIRQVDSITEEGIEGGTVAVETTEPARLVAELAARHGELPDLTVSRSTLEDIYLRMVEEPEVAR